VSDKQEDTMGFFDEWKLQVEDQKAYEIFDEGRARIVAVFYSKKEAKQYVKWRNKHDNRWRGPSVIR